MKQDNVAEELKKNAPWLYEQRQQEDGFKIPEGYFDTVEDRVLSRLEAAGPRRQAPQRLMKKPAKRFTLPQIFMAVAAVFSIAIAAVWFFKPITMVDQPLASVELSTDDIETYLLENVQDFEAEQLATLPDEDENEYQLPAQKTPSTSTDPLEEISPEDVEHILNDMTEEELEEIL